MLMEMLVLLSKHAGEVVSKEEIIERVWESRFVSESTLSRDVAVLRKLLDDDARNPRFIETISKRGLRLVASVTLLKSHDEVRIGVIPFENLNHDDENDYLADGFTDALTTELARRPGLRVISRQSMLNFKMSAQTIPEIAHELRAAALVEGSMMRTGDRIRVNAQLLEGPFDQHLWADTWEGKKASMLSNLGGVTGGFADAIRSILLPDAPVHPSPSQQVIASANIEYLKYRYHFAKWTEEGLRKGIAHLQQALEIDPTHAQAYAGLAWCLVVLGYWGFMPIEEAYPRAKAAAMRAISLEASSEARSALAAVRWLHDWNLAAMRSELSQALEMNPSNGEAHFLRGLYLATMDQDHDGAVHEARACLDLDPLSPMSNFSAAYLLLFVGEFEQAVDRAHRTLALYPDAPFALHALGWAETGLGRLAEATEAFEKANSIAPGAIHATYVAFAYGRIGRKIKACELLRALTETSGDPLPDFAQALVHIGLGDCDLAFQCLERSLAARDSRIFWFGVVPGLDLLRADPRFPDLMRRVREACRD
jgi:TolB-like protein/Flp pilus assembly protein TadD